MLVFYIEREQFRLNRISLRCAMVCVIVELMFPLLSSDLRLTGGVYGQVIEPQCVMYQESYRYSS